MPLRFLNYIEIFFSLVDANKINWSDMNVGLYTSMKVLSNSNVGIAYHDNTFEAGGLKYVSSGDANGATWNSPLMLVSGVAVGQ